MTRSTSCVAPARADPGLHARRRGAGPAGGGRAGRAGRLARAGGHLRGDRRLVRQVHPLPGGGGRGDRSRRCSSVDHHRGSEENQAGLGSPRRRPGRPGRRPHRHPALTGGGRWPAPAWRRRWSAWWATRPPWPRAGRTPLDFCFIDGGHGDEPAWADYRGWAPQVAVGRLAGHPRRVPRPGRRGPPPLRAVARPPWPRASSSRTAAGQPAGRSAGWTPPRPGGPAGPDRARVRRRSGPVQPQGGAAAGARAGDSARSRPAGTRPGTGRRPAWCPTGRRRPG